MASLLAGVGQLSQLAKLWLYLHGEILLDECYDGRLEVHAGRDGSLRDAGDALSAVRPHLLQRLVTTSNNNIYTSLIDRPSKQLSQ